MLCNNRVILDQLNTLIGFADSLNKVSVAMMGSSVDAVLRAIASQQCGPSPIPKQESHAG